MYQYAKCGMSRSTAVDDTVAWYPDIVDFGECLECLTKKAEIMSKNSSQFIDLACGRES